MADMVRSREKKPVQKNSLNARIGKRIAERREQLNWSMTKLSVVAELSQSTISRLEKGELGFSQETLSKVAGALAVSVDRLLSSGGNLEAARSDFRLIPVLDSVQAGKFSQVNYMLNDSEIRDTIPINMDCPPSVFAMRVKGDSMLPDFQEGDHVIVDPTRQPRPGSIVVAVDGEGDASLKRYRDVGVNSDGKRVFELVPLNPNYAPMRSDREQIGIVGVIIEHRRNLRF